MTRHLILIAALAGLLTSTVARAEVFYLDPEAGDMSGDGSASAPWSTLQEVWEAGLIETRTWDELPYEEGRTLVPKNAGAPVQPGDTLILRSGYHGVVEITGAYNADVITVQADTGATPRLGRLQVRSASGWTFQGLSISAEHAPTYETGTLVAVENHNWSGPVSDVVVEDCEIYSMDDVSGWSLQDWNDLPSNGISVSGTEVTIRNNLVRNINFGISVSGDHVVVEYNTVDSFAGDGLRGLGDYDVFQYNTVKNCYDVNENHDDGFQSWSRGADGTVGTGEVVGMVLRGNTILNYEDPNQPFRGTLQGIGCFDGFFTDWVVEDNVIITDHWHGITLLGARNSRIVNNTVIDLNRQDPGPPWIRIGDHKDGTHSSGCVIRNNLTTDLSAGEGVTEDHNIIVTMDASDQHFVDPVHHDLHLLPTSEAVDTGSADLAPDRDRDEVHRPQGDAVDVGAYEYYEGTPTDPGADDNGGCSCDTPGGGASGGLLVLLLVVGLMLRRRRQAGLAALILSAGLLAASPALAGCDRKCKKLCKRMESCLSKKQRVRRVRGGTLRWDRPTCLKNCKKMKLDKHAGDCLGAGEGGCLPFLECVGKGIKKAREEAGK